MSNKLPSVFIALLLILSQGLAGSGFIGYKTTELALKFTPQAMESLNRDLFSSGKTGLSAVDQVNTKYNARKIAAHFRLTPEQAANPQLQSLSGWFKVYFNSAVDAAAVAREYSQLNEIVRADAVPINAAYATSNDTRVADQWHINQANDADIDAPEGWDLNTGNGQIIVAVMDTGVEWWHQDLAGTNAVNSDRTTIKGNIWINTDEMNNTQATVDEDGNGYNDDWVGWDFVSSVNPILNLGDDYDTEDNDPRDKNSHGTHCAGNVGAINNNNRGIASAGGGWGEAADGSSNGVKIMALRIGWDDFPSGRVSMDYAANAFVYAANNGAKIASCSWGSSEYGPLVDAINTFLYGTTSPSASDPKIRLIFKAAGNDDNENTDYMTGRDDIISVAATEENDNGADFTSYGTWVDICAPGNNILSTIPGNSYTSYSGTSMATPITAGIAANLWSYDVNLTAEEVETYLYNGAENIDSHLSSKYLGKMGAGRVSLYGSLALIPVNHKPNAQNDVTETAEDTQLTIHVLANDSDSDNDALTIQSVSGIQNGSITFNDSLVIYTPATDFFGADSFQYVINDGNGATDTAQVNITVRSVNDAPVISGLPADVNLESNACTGLGMAQYASDVDTPDSLLSWSFTVSDPAAISYQYDAQTDTLTICSLGIPGDYELYATLTDDSSASDMDTIAVHVSSPSAIAGQNGAPRHFELSQNYPNPFNPVTTIRYAVAAPGRILIELFDVNGKKMATLVNSDKQPGIYHVTLNGAHFSSGVYVYRMTAGNFTKTRKLMLIK